MLDIVGLNLYHHNQAEVGDASEGDERRIVEPDDPRRVPTGEFLRFAWERYRRPILLAETSGYHDQRAPWLRTTMEESLAAIASGMDLQGVCLYPFVDVPEWVTGQWSKLGIYDLVDLESCVRTPCSEYLAEIEQWKRRLAHRVQGTEG